MSRQVVEINGCTTHDPDCAYLRAHVFGNDLVSVNLKTPGFPFDEIRDSTHKTQRRNVYNRVEVVSDFFRTGGIKDFALGINEFVLKEHRHTECVNITR